MSDSVAIATTSTPHAAAARARARIHGRAAPGPHRSRETRARPVARCASARPPRPAPTRGRRAACRFPRSTPVRCSTRVRPPTSPTSSPAADVRVRARRPATPCSSSARPLATAHTAALGNIEMPSFRQSVSRSMFTNQPTSVPSPPPMAQAEATSPTRFGHVADLLRHDGARAADTGRTAHWALHGTQELRHGPALGKRARDAAPTARRNSVASPVVICSPHPARMRSRAGFVVVSPWHASCPLRTELNPRRRTS